MKVAGEPEQPRNFGFFTFNVVVMNVTIKNGQRQTLKVTCKKVVISITTYRQSTKQVTRLKVKAKGKCSSVNQARL